jgi:hypothetical protein
MSHPSPAGVDKLTDDDKANILKIVDGHMAQNRNEPTPPEKCSYERNGF